jgi:hypothetical protein
MCLQTHRYLALVYLSALVQPYTHSHPWYHSIIGWQILKMVMTLWIWSISNLRRCPRVNIIRADASWTLDQLWTLKRSELCCRKKVAQISFRFDLIGWLAASPLAVGVCNLRMCNPSDVYNFYYTLTLLHSIPCFSSPVLDTLAWLYLHIMRDPRLAVDHYYYLRGVNFLACDCDCDYLYIDSDCDCGWVQTSGWINNKT